MLEVIVIGFKVVELFESHVFVSNHNCSESLGCEVILDDMVHNISFLLLGQFLSFEFVHHILSAYIEKKFGGALDKNSDILRIFVLFSNGNKRLLSLRIKWYIAYNSLFFISQYAFNKSTKAIFKEESDNPLLRSISNNYGLARPLVNLSMRTAIIQYTLDHKILIPLVLEPHLFESLSLNEHRVHGVESPHSHLVSGEGAGLIRDDLVGTAHRLGGLNLSDQTVALLHLGD